MAAIAVTVDGLRAWLESLPRDSVAGYTAHSHSCPIATHLTRTTGKSAEVSDVDWYVSGMAEPAQLDPVLSWFVALVDTRQAYDEITAADALALLNEAAVRAAQEEV